MKNLAKRIELVTEANGCDTNNYPLNKVVSAFEASVLDSSITIDVKGIIMKDMVMSKIEKQIARLEIPYMPQGHALITEVFNELSNRYFTTSNSYSV